MESRGIAGTYENFLTNIWYFAVSFGRFVAHVWSFSDGLQHVQKIFIKLFPESYIFYKKEMCITCYDKNINICRETANNND